MSFSLARSTDTEDNDPSCACSVTYPPAFVRKPAGISGRSSQRYVKPRRKPTGGLNSDTRLDDQTHDKKKETSGS